VTDISILQKEIGITFKNIHLLTTALTHSSFINENPGISTVSNERLEFLGDSVLGLAVSNKLYHDNPSADEGELTLLRSALVRKETLADMANKINLGDSLYMGKGEERGGGRKKAANLAGAFEALIAAIYLDQGFDTAASFILNLFKDEILNQAGNNIHTDYKSKLQEIIQKKHQITPSYLLIEATGPDHDRQFTVKVKLEDETLATGRGKSKKAAEMDAARQALKELPE
jgi:ribonuclease III